MMEETVELYIYDLSEGAGPVLIGKAIWHTSIVIYGREYYFGRKGIVIQNPDKPFKKQKLGVTKVPHSVFKSYIDGLSRSTFKNTSYNLLTHNCNSFSQEVAQYLCGTSIPNYIRDLPKEVVEDTLKAITMRSPLFDIIGLPDPIQPIRHEIIQKAVKSIFKN